MLYLNRSQERLLVPPVQVPLVLAVVPWVIAKSGRWDYYYTLTSVALLSIASAGVWLTFYIGRINIGATIQFPKRQLLSMIYS